MSTTTTPANGAEPCDAIDALTAAKLNREFARDGSSVFVHAPRPADVATPAKYSNQRRFGPGGTVRHHKLAMQSQEERGLRAEACVHRDAEFDLAELTLELGLYTCSSITVRMTPAELRDLARRLIDAAHDIEAHPAATLTGAEAEAA